MECSNCGNKVNINDKSCNQCGHKLSDEEIDNFITNQNNGYDWTVYKLSIIASLVFISVIFCFFWICCDGIDESTNVIDNSEIANDKIWSTMTNKAKLSSENLSTYDFNHQKNYKLNDSVSMYIQTYSFKNDYGVKKSGTVMGFFNTKTGDELSGVELESMTNDNEYNKIKSYINK